MARPKEISNEKILSKARELFLERGANISASEIAQTLGVSHTTIFNRFGSKKALLIASLGPCNDLPWLERLEKGPGETPIKEQLIEYGIEMASYFRSLQAGLSMLKATGISEEEIFTDFKEEHPSTKTFRVLSNWLKIAQNQGRLGECNIEILASTILSVLHSRAFSSCSHNENLREEEYINNLFVLLWNGIGI